MRTEWSTGCDGMGVVRGWRGEWWRGSLGCGRQHWFGTGWMEDRGFFGHFVTSV